jgi:spermidine/putrescine transport system substrate-binding protein
VESAHAFINFILDAKVAAAIVNTIGYASANEAARAFIKPEVLNNPVHYPGEDALSRCEFIADIGEATQTLDRYWTEIKTR